MSTDIYPRTRPMGDAALLIELGDILDVQLNLRVHALAHQLNEIPGITAVVPGYTTVLVEYEPAQVSPAALAGQIESAAAQIATSKSPLSSRLIEIPTRYGGAFGPDLSFIAEHNGLTPAQVIEQHTATVYQVFMIGFAPGFTYLGILPESISAPRLETPRKRVPAGSVGIAGRQTGIYPRESPGGWRLIGHTDVKLFDPSNDPPTLLQAGDQVRFIPIAL